MLAGLILHRDKPHRPTINAGWWADVAGAPSAHVTRHVELIADRRDSICKYHPEINNQVCTVMQAGRPLRLTLLASYAVPAEDC